MLLKPLDNANKHNELSTIITIAENNGYNRELVTQMYNQIKNNKQAHNKQIAQKEK
jgi:hypothetical protein